MAKSSVAHTAQMRRESGADSTRFFGFRSWFLMHSSRPRSILDDLSHGLSFDVIDRMQIRIMMFNPHSGAEPEM